MGTVNAGLIVQSAMTDLSPTTVPLPAPLFAAFSVLHQAHRTFRWIRKVHLYSQNCFKVAAGYGLNLAFGDSLMLRIAAGTVMIATRILECVKQQVKLQLSWNKWVDALKGNYSKPITVEWSAKASHEYFSESTISWLNYQSQRWLERIERIAIRTFRIARDVLYLSMRIADAIDDTLNVFSSSPTTINEGINEFFVNSSQWTDKLLENKELLLDGLKANKELIEKILTGMSSFVTVDQLIKLAEETIGKAASVAAQASHACNTGDAFISACAKKWGHEFLQTLGLESIIPREVRPASKPFWENVPRVIKRFPDLKKVTKPKIVRTPFSSPIKMINEKMLDTSPAYSPIKKKPAMNFSSPSKLTPVKSESIKDRSQESEARSRNKILT